MTQTKLDNLERQLKAHLATDCPLCLEAARNMDGRECSIAFQLTREIRRCKRNAAGRGRYQAYRDLGMVRNRDGSWE